MIPHSAADAVQAFQEKKPFTSVTLEADKNDQATLQALAFRMMAIAPDGDDWTINDFRIAVELELKGELDNFTKREIESAESLAYVALKEGYAKTIGKFPETHRHTLEF
jgi:hypothetical protein